MSAKQSFLRRTASPPPFGQLSGTADLEGIVLMTLIDIAEQADGFIVVKTENNARAGLNCECRDEVDAT